MISCVCVCVCVGGGGGGDGGFKVVVMEVFVMGNGCMGGWVMIGCGCCCICVFLSGGMLVDVCGHVGGR